MAKVFLSYAREDADAAKQLAEGIGRAGHEVWWDRHIQGGSRFSTRDRPRAQERRGGRRHVVRGVGRVRLGAGRGRRGPRYAAGWFRLSLGGSRPPLGFRQFHTVDLGDWNGEAEPADA